MSTALARAHITAEARLRALVTQAVGVAWSGLPGYDEDNVDQFLSTAVPIVRAGQRQSIAVTEAFLARTLGRRPVGIVPDEILDRLRNGAELDDVYRRPFVTVWTSLKENGLYDQAVAAGAARATSTAAMDVQLAMRGTMARVQEVDTSIRGYRRVADPGACTFCQAIDGAFVRSADAMALHNNCGCGLEPIVDANVTPSPMPDDIAVHEHGELGPVLGDPAHDFTGEHQLA